MSNKLIKAVAGCEKVCHQVHLPIQAGDDAVLKRMNRRYTGKDYMKLVKRIRKALNNQILNPKSQTNSKFKIQNSKLNAWNPPPAITTDIIVGFPGETKRQFNNTAELMRQVKFDMAYIARYSPRPGTAAEKLADDVPPEEKKRREEELMKILRKTALANNKKYLGRPVEVLVEERSKKGEWRGKTRTGKSVRIKNEELRMKNIKGKFIKVKITKAEDFGLAGEIIN